MLNLVLTQLCPEDSQESYYTTTFNYVHFTVLLELHVMKHPNL